MEDHYFGVIRPRVQAFMKELNEELWKLGMFAEGWGGCDNFFFNLFGCAES